MRLSLATAAGVMGLASWFALASCGLDKAGTGPVAPVDGSAADAFPDVVAGDAGGDAKSDAPAVIGDGGCKSSEVTCFGECVSTCAGCNAGEALCPTTRGCGRCGSDCPGRELACYACIDGGGPTVFCSSPAAKCGESLQHCACAGGTVESCPGQTQTCPGSECKTCGEDGTDRATCGSGKTCNASATPPACQ